MKWNKFKMYALVLVLMASMVISACSSNKEEAVPSAAPSAAPTATEVKAEETPEPVQEEVAKPLVKMSIFLQQGSQYEGIQSDPVAKEIEKRLGIQLDFVSINDDQFSVLAASGDLPDILLAKRSWLKVLIEGNNIIALDDLAANAPTIKGQTSANEFSKKYLSEGQGKLYTLSAFRGPVTPAYMYDTGPNVRWDYYKELGFPQMNNSDDFLQVLKQMQDKHPKTENGKKVYGFSLWNDWGTWPYKLYHAYGNGVEQLGTMEYNDQLASTNFLMDENSNWWKGIEFYYKANKMGLLDPESFTQKFDNMQAKGANGQILATYASWTTQLNAELVKQGKETSGFMPLPGMFPYVFHGGYSDNGNQDRLVVITKNNKNPDRAMELIDFAFSEEGSRLLWSGLEGTHWTKEGGKAHLTDEIAGKYNVADNEFVVATGITKYSKLAGLNDATLHTDGQLMNLALSPDIFKKRITPLEKDYSDHYGVVYPGQLYDKMAAENKLKFLDINTDFQVAVGSVSDDIKRIDDSLMTYISTNAPKVILAKSDAEFTSLKKAAIAEMTSKGLDQSNAYWTDLFTKTKASFANK